MLNKFNGVITRISSGKILVNVPEKFVNVRLTFIYLETGLDIKRGRGGGIQKHKKTRGRACVVSRNPCPALPKIRPSFAKNQNYSHVYLIIYGLKNTISLIWTHESSNRGGQIKINMNTCSEISAVGGIGGFSRRRLKK
jgi:hypothetical protein